MSEPSYEQRKIDEFTLDEYVWNRRKGESHWEAERIALERAEGFAEFLRARRLAAEQEPAPSQGAQVVGIDFASGRDKHVEHVVEVTPLTKMSDLEPKPVWPDEGVVYVGNLSGRQFKREGDHVMIATAFNGPWERAVELPEDLLDTALYTPCFAPAPAPSKSQGSLVGCGEAAPAPESPTIRGRREKLGWSVERLAKEARSNLVDVQMLESGEAVECEAPVTSARIDAALTRAEQERAGEQAEDDRYFERWFDDYGTHYYRVKERHHVRHWDGDAREWIACGYPWPHVLDPESGFVEIAFASLPAAARAALASKPEPREADTSLLAHVAQLRHLYDGMIAGDIVTPKAAADGLLAPAIRAFEKHLASVKEPREAEAVALLRDIRREFEENYMHDGKVVDEPDRMLLRHYTEACRILARIDAAKAGGA